MKKFLLFIIYLLIFIVFAEILSFRVGLIYVEKEFGIQEDIKYAYSLKKTFELKEFFSSYNYSTSIQYSRPPVGLNYKTSPITIFGCSFAYGQLLKINQTFGAKLSEQTKHPVYNVAIPGRGLSEMYFLSTDNNFYKKVPPSNSVIYIFIDDHYRRMLLPTFHTISIWQNYNYKYDKKNDKLIMTNYLPLNKIFSNSYFCKLINNYLTYKYINNPKNAEELTDLTLVYFIKTRENLEKRWNKKINFTVIIYEQNKQLYKNLLRKKLEQNGFIVIDTRDITKEDLNNQKYKAEEVDFGHPSEAAWDLLTPLIIKELNKKNVIL